MPEETYNDDGLEYPHCHHVNKDSWELGNGRDNSGETECGHCDMPIIWDRHVTVSYIGKAKAS